MLHSGQNSAGTLVGLLEFTYLGTIYSYPTGPEYSGGSDRTWNSGSSSNPNIVLANHNRHGPHTSKTSFSSIRHLFIKCYS